MGIDGMAAAFAAYLLLGDNATYIGIGHGGPSKKLPDDVDGKNVAIVDFSFDAETMAELKLRAKTFVVLDHHFSAMNSLKSVADEDKVSSAGSVPLPSPVTVPARSCAPPSPLHSRISYSVILCRCLR
jgi:hypothetical protein